MTIKVHNKLLLTGAAGGLGKALRERLKANCTVLRLSDRESFADAIQSIRARCVVGGNGLVLPVKARDVVGAGKHHALDAVRTGGLVQVEDAKNIGLQNRGERSFNRDAA